MKITTSELAVTTAIPLDTRSQGIVLLDKKTTSLPKERSLMKASRTARVEVFIPPPHEPGDAPINIKIIMMKSVELENRVRSMVLNPVVLAVAD